LIHKRPGYGLSPSGRRPFSAVSRNPFRPVGPRNGPEWRFRWWNPTIIWEKGGLGAPGSAGASLLLGEVQKVYVPFWPPRARKTAETARFGPSAGKTESTAATPPKFASFYPLEFFGLIHKRPGYDPFFAENPFSPADEFVFMGLVVRSCHFDVTACAETRRLENKHFLIMSSKNVYSNYKI